MSHMCSVSVMRLNVPYSTWSVRRSVSSADEHACRSVLYLYISRLPRWISNTPSTSSTFSTSQVIWRVVYP